jgi:hypothetical protein
VLEWIVVLVGVLVCVFGVALLCLLASCVLFGPYIFLDPFCFLSLLAGARFCGPGVAGALLGATTALFSARYIFYCLDLSREFWER